MKSYESYELSIYIKNFSCIVSDKKKKKKLRFYNSINFTNYKLSEYFKNILKNCSIRYQRRVLIFSERAKIVFAIIEKIENSRIYKKISKVKILF